MLKKIIYFLFCKVFYRVKCINKEVVNNNRKSVICINHTKWQDGVIMWALIKDPAVMCKEELFKNKLLAKIFKSLGMFPIKRGKKDFSSILHAVNVVNDERPLIIFPEGTRNAREKGVKAKIGAVYIATAAKAPIIPVHITEKYRPFSKVIVNFGDIVNYDIDHDSQEKLKNKELMNVYTEDLISKIYKLKVEDKEAKK